jgi:hypothetical protein
VGGKILVNKQQTVTEKYLRHKGKIAVISFLQNKIFSPLDIMGKYTLDSILIVSFRHGSKWGKNISNQTLVYRNREKMR